MIYLEFGLIQSWILNTDTLNSHHDSTKVMYNLQLSQIEFLDTEVFIIKEEWTLGSRVFFKPMDTDALL